MKKLLNISVIAALAVLPVAANAARDNAVAVANYTATGSATALATTSYVQGAYEQASDRIDALVTDTAVAAKQEGNYAAIHAGDSVSENLVALDTAVAGLTSGNGSVTNQIKTQAAAADYTNESMTGITTISGAIANLDTRTDALETTMGDTSLSGVTGLNASTATGAIVELQNDKQEKSDSTITAAQDAAHSLLTEGSNVAGNLVSIAGAVETLNADDTTTGSVAKQIKDAISTVNGNAGDLNSLTTTQKGSLVAAINELDSDKQEKSDSTVANGTYAHITQGTGVGANLLSLNNAVVTNDTAIATINNKQIPIVSDWSTNDVTNTKISDLGTYGAPAEPAQGD